MTMFHTFTAIDAMRRYLKMNFPNGVCALTVMKITWKGKMMTDSIWKLGVAVVIYILCICAVNALIPGCAVPQHELHFTWTDPNPPGMVDQTRCWMVEAPGEFEDAAVIQIWEPAWKNPYEGDEHQGHGYVTVKHSECANRFWTTNWCEGFGESGPSNMVEWEYEPAGTEE